MKTPSRLRSLARPARALVIALLLLVPSTAAQAAPDAPLSHWRDGAAKTALMDFVARVTGKTPDFVAPEERIAVFDNDGTLWSEQPVYVQVQFALDRIKALAPTHPEWQATEPFKSVLAGDMKALAASGQKGIVEILAATHSGLTTEEFADIVRTWLKGAQHPKYARRYDRCVYEPMLDVLAYLRAHQFKIYIVSGGGVDFMRAFAEEAYGIPPERVIGSTGVVTYEVRDGKPTLVKTDKLEHMDDGPGKPVGIHRAIGRRPILAFGNSDGDFEMLDWTTSGPGPRLGLLVHHTDAEREVAYDRGSHIGKLEKALDAAPAKGWIVVDMKRDWATVFP